MMEERAVMQAFGNMLTYAVSRCSPASVRDLLQDRTARAFLDAPDPKVHMTPLVICPMREDDDAAAIARRLIDAGAQVDKMDGVGCPPLHGGAGGKTRSRGC